MPCTNVSCGRAPQVSRLVTLLSQFKVCSAQQSPGLSGPLPWVTAMERTIHLNTYPKKSPNKGRVTAFPSFPSSIITATEGPFYHLQLDYSVTTCCALRLMRPTHLICIKPISWLHILGTFQAAALRAKSFHAQSSSVAPVKSAICFSHQASSINVSYQSAVIPPATNTKQGPALSRVSVIGQENPHHYTNDTDKKSCIHSHLDLRYKLTGH